MVRDPSATVDSCCYCYYNYTCRRRRHRCRCCCWWPSCHNWRLGEGVSSRPVAFCLSVKHVTQLGACDVLTGNNHYQLFACVRHSWSRSRRNFYRNSCTCTSTTTRSPDTWISPSPGRPTAPLPRPAGSCTAVVTTCTIYGILWCGWAPNVQYNTVQYEFI